MLPELLVGLPTSSDKQTSFERTQHYKSIVASKNRKGHTTSCTTTVGVELFRFCCFPTDCQVAKTALGRAQSNRTVIISYTSSSYRTRYVYITSCDKDDGRRRPDLPLLASLPGSTVLLELGYCAVPRIVRNLDLKRLPCPHLHSPVLRFLYLSLSNVLWSCW